MSLLATPGPLGTYSDAARRCADSVNQHVWAGHGGRGYVAIRLSDGGSDGVIYDTKAAAVRHQLHEHQCAYIRLPLAPMAAKEAAVVLAWHRQAYDAGLPLADPDRTLIQPIRQEVWGR